jgi:zinc protease
MKRWLRVLSVPLLLAGCSTFPTSMEAVREADLGSHALPIQQWQTEAGSRVLFVNSPTLPMVDVRLVFDAGSARDGDHYGVASLTSALIGEGAEGLDVEDIARGFEALGVSYGASSYRDMAIVEMRSLTDPDYFEPALDLFTRMVSTPTFPQTALERIRQQYLTGLQREKQVPGPQVSKAYNRVLFGEHPYGHPSDGTEDSLPAIRREQLARFHQTYYAAGNAVIAITGDLSDDQARQLAERLSSALPAGEAAPALPRAHVLEQQIVSHQTFDSEQTILLLGNQAIYRGHPDWVPLYVGNYILGGGGFASILTDEVREGRGYVYGIHSSISPMAAAGPFSIQFRTANDNADDALALTLALVSDFVGNGPTAAQVEDAVNNITGSFALDVAENDDIVGQLGAIGFYNLPTDYLQWFEAEVRKVTPESIRAAFQRNLDPDDLAIVSIGPQAPAVPERSGADATK